LRVIWGELDKSTTTTTAAYDKDNYDDAKATTETTEEAVKFSISHFNSPPRVN
jgi:hypothetical protein